MPCAEKLKEKAEAARFKKIVRKRNMYHKIILEKKNTKNIEITSSEENLDDEEDAECIYCQEHIHSISASGEGWARCMSCMKWAHEEFPGLDPVADDDFTCDEVRMGLHTDNNSIRVWRRTGERNHPSMTVERHQQFGGSILFWAGVMFGRRTPLVSIEGNMTAAVYENNILQPIFKVCHGSLYVVMWLANEPREFNLPTLKQRRITYVPEKLPGKYGVHSEEYLPIQRIKTITYVFVDINFDGQHGYGEFDLCCGMLPYATNDNKYPAYDLPEQNTVRKMLW
ncbi:hypothetical protein ANN_25055 [Periplaneta americana]|uniref:Uncharacterized protein n=1 Tax=Periplaneta americana TaxID=6978 RepID=A0ABQ8S0D6_PERAM|nr:hypothetical protein ANN_25055 [Periplaneta americana]